MMGKTIIENIYASNYRCCSNPAEVCHGTGCMAWVEETLDVPPPPPVQEDYCVNNKVPIPTKTGNGYCGLVK